MSRPELLLFDLFSQGVILYYIILTSSGGANRRDSQEPTAIYQSNAYETHLFIIFSFKKHKTPAVNVIQITFYNTIIKYYSKLEQYF